MLESEKSGGEQASKRPWAHLESRRAQRLVISVTRHHSVHRLRDRVCSPSSSAHEAPSVSVMATYDSLHRQCRTLESLFDTKLTSYSRLASTITRNQDDLEAGGSSERWRDMEAEVDELLEKVRAYDTHTLTRVLSVRSCEKSTTSCLG